MIFSKKKRFIIFNDGLTKGGTEQLLINLLAHLVQKDCDVTLILLEESDKNIMLDKIPEEVKIKYLFSTQDSNFAKKRGELKMIYKTKSFMAAREIFEEDYDEVICFKEGFYAKMFSQWGIPKTLWVHNILYKREYEINSLRDKFSVWLNKKKIAKTQESYSAYERVICVSEACKKAYVNIVYDGYLPIQDIRIVPNAIKQEDVIALSKEDISDHWQTKEGVNFILLARQSPEKRIDRVINASKKLLDEGYKFNVHILGQGTNSDEFIKTIVDLAMEDVISLYGDIDNPYPYIKKADWLICSSERESFSLAILEAMILGTPIITTDCGGPTNIVENGRYGLLTENSSEGVYTGMKTVLDDTTLQTKYSTEQEKVLSYYKYENWIKTVNKLLSI